MMGSGADNMGEELITPTQAELIKRNAVDDDTDEEEAFKTIEDRIQFELKQVAALSQQVGGSHYKDFAIQPTEFIHRNKIGFVEGCIIKRICRWRLKDGVQDLKKAIHEIEMLIELEGLA
jgi:hypothetical protein